MRRTLPLILLFLSALPLTAQRLPSYTASYKSIDANGTVSVGKIAVSAPQLRVETQIKGQDSVLLIDWEKFTLHVLSPKAATDLVLDASPYKGKILDFLHQTMNDPKLTPEQKEKLQKLLHPDFRNLCAALPQEMGCEQLGVKTVGERSCANWRFSSKDKKLPNGESESLELCLDNELHLPLAIRRVDGKGTTSFEMAEIKLGPVDASLFAIPEDYAKMDMSQMIEGMIHMLEQAAQQKLNKQQGEKPPAAGAAKRSNKPGAKK